MNLDEEIEDCCDTAATSAEIFRSIFLPAERELIRLEQRRAGLKRQMEDQFVKLFRDSDLRRYDWYSVGLIIPNWSGAKTDLIIKPARAAYSKRTGSFIKNEFIEGFTQSQVDPTVLLHVSSFSITTDTFIKLNLQTPAAGTVLKKLLKQMCGVSATTSVTIVQHDTNSITGNKYGHYHILLGLRSDKPFPNTALYKTMSKNNIKPLVCSRQRVYDPELWIIKLMRADTGIKYLGSTHHTVARMCATAYEALLRDDLFIVHDERCVELPCNKSDSSDIDDNCPSTSNDSVLDVVY